MNWKEAVEQTTRYACYDNEQTHMNLAEGDGCYYLSGSVGEVAFTGESSEDGLPRMLEELNIDPNGGGIARGEWYSL